MESLLLKTLGLFRASLPFLLFLSLSLLAACAGPPPPEAALDKIQSPGGKRLEQRIVRHLSRRPIEIFHVYRDSSGNFVRHGPDIHYFLDGQVKFQEQYRDGKLDGVTEFWYANGAKEGELPYRDGKPHGKAVSWHPNGKKKSEKTWSMGRPEGPALEWNDKGERIGDVPGMDNAPDSARIDRGSGAASP